MPVKIRSRAICGRTGWGLGGRRACELEWITAALLYFVIIEVMYCMYCSGFVLSCIAGHTNGT